MTQPVARYTRTAIFLHWLIAVFLLLNSAVGVAAANFVSDSTRRELLNLHKPLGIMLLALIVIRVAWRVLNRPPILPATVGEWEQRASKWSHRTLYLVMLVLPLSGWMLTSAAPKPHSIMIGDWAFPFLPMARSWAMADSAHTVHVVTASALAVFVILHILAVVHHSRRGASVLPRMLFGSLTGSGFAPHPDV